MLVQFAYETKKQFCKQGRIHDNISRVRLGRGSNEGLRNAHFPIVSIKIISLLISPSVSLRNSENRNRGRVIRLNCGFSWSQFRTVRILRDATLIVGCTQLYKSLCRSVCLSVTLSFKWLFTLFWVIFIWSGRPSWSVGLSVCLSVTLFFWMAFYAFLSRFK